MFLSICVAGGIIAGMERQCGKVALLRASIEKGLLLDLALIDKLIPNAVRLERERRKQRAYAILGVTVILLLGAALSPWVAQMTAAFGSLMAATTALGSVASPIVGPVGGALICAFLPVLYFWRSGRR